MIIHLQMSLEAWQILDVVAIYKHDQGSSPTSQELHHFLNAYKSTFSRKSWTLGAGNFVVCDRITITIFSVQHKISLRDV